VIEHVSIAGWEPFELPLIYVPSIRQVASLAGLFRKGRPMNGLRGMTCASSLTSEH